MKFKYIIIGFNIIIIFFLLIVTLVPIFVLGMDSARRFFLSGWPVALILLATLVGLNVFFLFNRRLFLLLEREDWPALVDYLERRVYDGKRYSRRLVRLLANSYVIMSDSAGVLRLERKLALAKPALVESNALVFGAARILGGNPVAAAAFFSARLEKGKADEPQWVRWYYGFSLLLSRSFDKAEAEFRDLAAAGDDALVIGLSAWFLSDTLCKFSANQEECRAAAEQGRRRVREKLKSAEDWQKEASKIETEVHAALIKKYIDQSAAWLFQKGQV